MTRFVLVLLLVSLCSVAGCGKDKKNNSDDRHASPESNDNPSAPAPTNQGGQVVGSAGGHFEFGNGISLDVPPGAIQRETELSISFETMPPGMAGVDPSRLLFSAELRPSGLSFAVPIQLSFPIRPAPNGAMIDMQDVDVILAPEFDSGRSVASDDDVGDEPQAELLTASTSGDGRLRVDIPHFSSLGIVRAIQRKFCPPLGDLRSSSTASIDTRHISQQILDEFLRTNPGTLVPIVPKPGKLVVAGGIEFVVAEGKFPLSSPSSVAALNAAAMIAPEPIYINAAWRSLATQYVLARSSNASGNIVAKVGKSPHGVGAGLDIQPGHVWDTIVNNQLFPLYSSSTKTNTNLVCRELFNRVCTYFDVAGQSGCAADELFGQNAAALRNDFQLLTCQEDACCDPVHWDHRADPNLNDTLRQSAILAFQTLWNLSNPCGIIPAAELGRYIDESAGPSITMEALLKTPSCGFDAAYLTQAFVVPPEGTLGAGCDSAVAVGPASTLCCPHPASPTGVACEIDQCHRPCTEFECSGSNCAVDPSFQERPENEQRPGYEQDLGVDTVWDLTSCVSEPIGAHGQLCMGVRGQNDPFSNDGSKYYYRPHAQDKGCNEGFCTSWEYDPSSICPSGVRPPDNVLFRCWVYGDDEPCCVAGDTEACAALNVEYVNCLGMKRDCCVDGVPQGLPQACGQLGSDPCGASCPPPITQLL